MARTAMLTQYEQAKREAGGAILFFHLGDFFETFYDDARVASEVLGITLTARPQGDERIPMAGVPVRTADRYIGKLLDRGYRVALCEQVEDPKDAHGIVRREIVEIITPGTVLDPHLLDERVPTRILAVGPLPPGAETPPDGSGAGLPAEVGLAWADASTGRLVAADVPMERIVEEIARIDPAEILYPDDLDAAGSALLAEAAPRAARTSEARSLYAPAEGVRLAMAELGVASLEAFGFAGSEPCIGAAGALLHYLKATKKGSLAFIERIQRTERGSRLLLCRRSRSALELVSAGRDDPLPVPVDGANAPASAMSGPRAHRWGSLLWRIDRTRTAMGARRLREWLLSPLADPEEISERQDAIAALSAAPDALADLGEALGGVHDLERLAARIARGKAGPMDLVALRRSIERIPLALAAVASLDASLLRETRDAVNPLDGVRERIARTLVDDPPHLVSEGGVIRDGFSPDLDALRTTGARGRDWIATFEVEEQARTGIPSLKVGYNKVFGYYIEVTRPQLARVPPDYARRQTLKSAERFVNEALRRHEEAVLGAGDRARALEGEIFRELLRAVEAEAREIRRTANALADLDALASLARMAREPGWVRPRVTAGGGIAIRGGRHPVLEATLHPEPFVANDLALDRDGEGPSLLVVTGPNMAGKSTYIRQAALLVILAQMGSWIPADSATLGVVDRIFTRVGSADDIGRGLSTFMVEMIEAAVILRRATPQSLVVLDELGRGTSTYDGLALAWAIAERLARSIRCRTLFATHYHELTALAGETQGVANVRVLVQEDASGVRFLHRIVPGAADRSYGIHVARLAGVPAPVIDRANAILADLEAQRRLGEPAPGTAPESAPPAPVAAAASAAPDDQAAPDGQNAPDVQAASEERVPGQRTLFHLPAPVDGRLVPVERASGAPARREGAPAASALEQIVARLRETDVLRTAPIQALSLLDELRTLSFQA